MSQKTWGGRFDAATDKRVEAFSESVTLDRRLYQQDITASKAHAAMLAEVGLLTPAEAETISTALDAIGTDIDAGRMEYDISLEDIHTHIERALITRVGDLGRRLHTARSRNDQVITDVKLWVREAIGDLDALLRDLQKAFLIAAVREQEVILPGYTHLQRAQPVLAAHYYLAYVEKFQRDRERLADCRKRLNVLPLGAAALAGTSLPIDRESVRQKLGFDSVARNSLDVSSDRDFLVEFVFCLSLTAIHLSSWAEEWVIWSTTEFNFLKLPDGFCTGSSIMPHKKNPDTLELTRGKTGRVIGALNQLLVLLKGLPLAYNRDLQEDKSALFDAFDTVAGCVSVAAPLVEQTTLRREVIASRLEDGFLDATTLMEFFVKIGVPMRSAHEAVGKLVRKCEQSGCRLVDLPDTAFEEACPGSAAGVRPLLGVANAVAAFTSYGSTAPVEVQRQLQEWTARLEQPIPAIA
ncbi:MAG: argininosuccinate lyase [Bacteroidales bacterium]|nr:argininosuccinate lyase [Bacteroidales bacterium]